MGISCMSSHAFELSSQYAMDDIQLIHDLTWEGVTLAQKEEAVGTCLPRLPHGGGEKLGKEEHGGHIRLYLRIGYGWT